MVNKKKILFYLPVYGDGGIEKVVSNLSDGLSDEYDVAILAQASDIKNFADSFFSSKKYLLFGAPSGKFFQTHLSLIFQLFNLMRVIIFFRPDLIISCYQRNHLVVGFLRFVLRLDFKWISYDHGEPAGYFGKAKYRNKIKEALVRFFVRPDIGVAVSKHVANKVSDLYKTSFYVINNPVLINDFEGELVDSIDGVPTIVSAGRLTKSKGFDDLIKAFSIVVKQRKSKLLILGDGDEKRNLSKLINDLNLSDSVSLVGFIKNPWIYLASSNVFAFASYSEGAPLVIYEALSLGLPVVAYNIDAIEEINDGGIAVKLVNIGDVKELARSILAVLNSDDLRIAMCEDALRVSKSYSYEIFLAKWSDLIRNVA